MTESNVTSSALQERILHMIKEQKLTQTGGLILLQNISMMDDPDKYIDDLEEHFESLQRFAQK